KQHLPERVLQLLDLLAQRWLRYIALFGGAGEASGPSHRNEIAELMQFHRCCLSKVSDQSISLMDQLELQVKPWAQSPSKPQTRRTSYVRLLLVLRYRAGLLDCTCGRSAPGEEGADTRCVPLSRRRVPADYRDTQGHRCAHTGLRRWDRGRAQRRHG